MIPFSVRKGCKPYCFCKTSSRPFCCIRTSEISTALYEFFTNVFVTCPQTDLFKGIGVLLFNIAIEDDDIYI